MFKLSTNVTDSDKNEIKEINNNSFGHKAFTNSNNSEYALIYKNNKVVSCACISKTNKFIHNLCTDPNYRKQGHSKSLIKLILDKYRYINSDKLLYMNTENNDKGIIPTKIYKKKGWLLENDNHTNYRNNLYYFPTTGISKNNISILKNKNVICNLYKKHNFITFVEQLIYFILQEPVVSKNFKYDNCKSFYHKILLHKNSNNENKMFNHVLYLYNNENTKYLLKNTKYNFNNFNNFLLIVIKKIIF